MDHLDLYQPNGPFDRNDIILVEPVVIVNADDVVTSAHVESCNICIYFKSINKTEKEPAAEPAGQSLGDSQ